MTYNPNEGSWHSSRSVGQPTHHPARMARNRRWSLDLLPKPRLMGADTARHINRGAQGQPICRTLSKGGLTSVRCSEGQAGQRILLLHRCGYGRSTGPVTGSDVNHRILGSSVHHNFCVKPKARAPCSLSTALPVQVLSFSPSSPYIRLLFSALV